MTKPTIVTRAGKGAPLSTTEGDSNFTNLRDSTIGVLADGTTVTTDLNGSFEIEAGSGITVTGNNSSKKITIANSQTAFSGAYADLTGKPTNVSSFSNDAGYLTSINSSRVTTALGFTPEDAANRNVSNGYAGLDGSGKIAASLLPSYVDDVVEAANYAALPGTGETSKIYVTVDTNKTYRWSGSAYVEISASPGSTDGVTEGSTNLYFTTARARASISGTGSIAYDSSTGVISYTGGSAGIGSVSEDTAPSLGGNLNVNGNSIVSLSNGNINITPNGTGKVVLSGNAYPAVQGSNGQVLRTNGSGTLSWVDVSSDWVGTATSDLDMATYKIKSTSNQNLAIETASGSWGIDFKSNSNKFGYLDSNVTLTTNGVSSMTVKSATGGTIVVADNISAGGHITLTPAGSGKINLAGPLKTSTTSGTPTTFNTSYFEGTLDTPVSWLKIDVGGSNYYLPMFQ
jgi:hypothetical protein